MLVRNRRPALRWRRTVKILGAVTLLAALSGCVVYPGYGPPGAVYFHGGCCWWGERHDWR